MNAKAECPDWTTADQVVRARNVSNELHDALSHLWILARQGEPETDMEVLVLRQIDDAMAHATEVFSELKDTLEWLVERELHKPAAAQIVNIERITRNGGRTHG